MKRYFIFFAAAAAASVSCSRIEELVAPLETEWIRFSTPDGIVASGAVFTRAMENDITCDITDWEYVEEGETKASLTETLSGEAGVFGYNFNSWDGSAKPTVMCNMRNTIENGTLTPETKVLWKNFTSSNFRFYAYAPYGKFTTSDANFGGVPYLTYTVPTTNKDQIDVLYATSTDVASTNRQSVPLSFNHAMTALQFRVGFEGATLKSVTISGIHNSGKLSLDGTWSNQSGSASYTVASQDSLLIMIPQTVADDARISLTYNDGTSDKTISASLDGQVWTPGKKVIYTLGKKGEETQYIYFDVALGDVKITSTSYSGYINVGSGVDNKQQVTGSHSDSNKYYIYCSVKTNSDANCTDVWSKNTGYKTQSDFNNRANGTIPVIPPYTSDIYGVTHMSGGKYASIPNWGKFITNETNVYLVKQTWDSGDQNYSSTNKIYICGPESGSSVFDITLDRVFLRSPDQHLDKDWKGSITIGHDGSGFKNYFSEKVTIRLKNNNVLGRIQYRKPLDVNTDSYLKITSADGDGVAKGTLVVAATKSDTTSAAPTQRVVSLIGAATENQDTEYDDDRGKRDRMVKDLYFDGGIVYVGSQKYENSKWNNNKSLMATIGGVNSWSEITINGGILTAVSNNTCPAIGGGGGWESSGGHGVVTINGGTVYAYSFGVLGNFEGEETILAPPAIGGGSTLGAYYENSVYIPANAGGCDVKINGGNVYAYSVGGPAIGGGSAGRHTAGDCNLEIRGGNIVAKSLAGKIGGRSVAATNAIGGGRSGYVDGNGGTATVKIYGGTLTTGSVGGGSVDERNPVGKTGSADITVAGGTTSAQFIMAKGSEEDPSFNMTGGIIQSSNTSDTEYSKVQENGGAVYIESGSCTINGGTISNCFAQKGGAIYLDGGDFVMTGGSISNCYSQVDGGAVYVNSGDATVSGGSISHNIASNGNGGGVYVSGGNFSMPKNGNGLILDNAADCKPAKSGSTYYGGNGGGIYVRSMEDDVTVDILGGKVIGNAAERNGGGLCVDMEGSTRKATITIGTVGGQKSDPDIEANSAALSGGGMAVQGVGSNIIINSGTVKGNVSAFVKNEDIRNDGGTVELVGKNVEGQPDQVDVKYNTIKFYANNGVDPEPYDEQRVITSTNSPLHPTAAALAFEKEFYHISHWNTKRDGSGTSYQLNGGNAVMNITDDVSLYAQWVRNQ